MTSIAVPPVTPVVKRLIIANVVVWFFVQIILGHFGGISYENIFFLSPNLIIEKFQVWQLATYMFFHALSPFHLMFNMLILWFFGSELESLWGRRFFSIYYFGSGIGAGLIYCLCIAVFSAVTGSQGALYIKVMGASGALYGLLLAYGILFAERITYFMGIFPMKAKYFVMVAGAIDFASLLSSGVAGGEVAYLAHLGGLAAGFIILKTKSVQLKKQKRKNVSLKLVVDNEKQTKNNSDPKYWN
jgi:membrane associated rhomboid family serine protease